jgi:hypothetical protein
MKFQLLEQALEVLREQGLRPQIEIGAHFKVLLRTHWAGPAS